MYFCIFRGPQVDQYCLVSVTRHPHKIKSLTYFLTYLQPRVLKPEVITSWGLTSTDLTTKGSYRQGSFNQRSLHPGVFTSRGLTTRCFTKSGSYIQTFYQKEFLNSRTEEPLLIPGHPLHPWSSLVIPSHHSHS